MCLVVRVSTYQSLMTLHSTEQCEWAAYTQKHTHTHNTQHQRTQKPFYTRARTITHTHIETHMGSSTVLLSIRGLVLVLVRTDGLALRTCGVSCASAELPWAGPVRSITQSCGKSKTRILRSSRVTDTSYSFKAFSVQRRGRGGHREPASGRPQAQSADYDTRVRPSPGGAMQGRPVH